MSTEVTKLDPPCRNKPPNARYNAPWYSLITHAFNYPLLSLGKKRALVEDDLDDLDPFDDSNRLYHEFTKHWNAELKNNPENPSLWNCLFLTITYTRYFRLCLNMLLFFVNIPVQILLLNKILAYIEGKNNNTSLSTIYVYCFILSLLVNVTAFVQHYSMYELERSGTLFKIILQTAIFSKSLKISSNSISTGQIVNLMSNDTQRYIRFIKFLNFGLWAPIMYTLGVIIVSLYIVKSWFPFLGYALTLLFIPIQMYFSSRFGKLRDQSVIFTDNRLKLINQILIGFLSMKMYCWESSLVDLVKQSRHDEMKYIKRAAIIKGVNLTIYTSFQILVILVIFVPYYFKNNKLEASVLFPTLAFFLRFRRYILLQIPNLIMMYSEVKVSDARIKEFLLSPELKLNNKLSNKRSDPSITFKNCRFTWDKIPSISLKMIITSKKGKKKKVNSVSQVQEKYLLSKTTSSKSILIDGDSDTITNHRVVLNDINVTLNGNNLIAIIGKIGSGKSSLLYSIINEIPLVDDLKSSISITGSISYVSQRPWIFNSSIRDNILFGDDYNEEWYNKVVYACGLLPDFKEFKHGDFTIIGERGINLSGGQKSRINLARGIYHKSKILLLDDPLAAVDSVVGSHIFNNAISKNGICNDRLVLLVTHQIQFLSKCDKIIALKDGNILYNDTYDNLKEKGINLEDLIDDDKNKASSPKKKESILPKQESKEENETSEEKETEMIEMVVLDNKKSDSNNVSPQSTVQNGSKLETIELNDNDTQQKLLKDKANKDSIIKSEAVETGGVSYNLYLGLYDGSIFSKRTSHSDKNKKLVQIYLKMLLLFVLLLMTQFWMTFSEIWIGIWSSKTENNQNKSKYSNIYYILVVLVLIFVFIRVLSFLFLSLNGSIILHNNMFESVIYAPMEFFESNPVGRILNRFSKDQYFIDERLPELFYDALQLLVVVNVTFLLIIVSNWILIFLLIPIMAFLYWVRYTFMSSSVHIKRLEAKTRSPIFSQFSVILSGLDIIRTYNKQNLMLNKFFNMINLNTRMSLGYFQISRWMGFLFDSSVGIILALTLFISVATLKTNNDNNENRSKASEIGIALAYLVTLTAMLQFMTKFYAELSNMMTSVERIIEYIKLPIEGKNDIIKNKKQMSDSELNKLKWPSNGKLEIQNLNARYRENLPLVLKNINLVIEPKSKIGVVGRTGSGKSSLFLCIYRLLEFGGGNILIDNVNTQSISLHKLRSHLMIIPQTPVIFSESLRYNIDPFSEHSDKEILEIIKKIGLYDLISNKLPNGLNTIMSQNGSNFSVGETQLICIVRAILKKDKCAILLIDEATSNIDPITDKIIQKVIKTEFKDITVLTIAHRLQTVLNSDKILVLDNGKIIEFDSPNNLLKKDKNDKKALFLKMYNESLLQKNEVL